MTPTRIALAALGLALSTSCSETLVPIALPGAQTAPLYHGDDGFDVIARSSSIADPLPVSGSSVAFAGLEGALTHALAGEIAHRPGLSLTVELVSAEATFDRSRLSVVLVARATLREREGNSFVAQSQAVCRDSALVRPENGAHVVGRCLTRLSHDVGGWLDGLPL